MLDNGKKHIWHVHCPYVKSNWYLDFTESVGPFTLFLPLGSLSLPFSCSCSLSLSQFMLDNGKKTYMACPLSVCYIKLVPRFLLSQQGHLLSFYLSVFVSHSLSSVLLLYLFLCLYSCLTHGNKHMVCRHNHQIGGSLKMAQRGYFLYYSIIQHLVLYIIITNYMLVIITNTVYFSIFLAGKVYWHFFSIYFSCTYSIFWYHYNRYTVF